MIEFDIASSRNSTEVYKVSLITSLNGPNHWRCGCKGFTYRRTCHHIKTANTALLGGVLGMRTVVNQ
jgi:hypothetical protein